MEIFKQFFKKYWIFLFVIVLITFGQTLWMQVWRDANAVFFKFNHLYEPAGYLGVGILGSGTYKFSVTPYLPIYFLFGYKFIWLYYLFNLIFYFLAAFFIYRLFAKIISPNVGKLAGFLFAASYIASEGFFSLDSSMILNVSIILICLSLIFYENFSRYKKILFYFTALFFYFLACFLTPVRVHYFIAVIFLFDFFWINKLNFRKIHLLFLRILPFLIIFYFYFVKDADSRTFLIIPFIKDILTGKIYNLYSTFGSLGYLFLPDRQLSSLVTLPYPKVIFLLFTSSILYFGFRNNSFLKRIVIMYVVLNFVWYFVSNLICSYPQVANSLQNNFSVFIGGEIILFLFAIFLLSKKETRLQIAFLFAWLFANLITYTSYEPTNIYTTTERYLAHSFVPLVAIFALSIKKYPKKRIFYFLAILWGMINIFNSVIYEHQVLITRSFPTESFYGQLEKDIPKLQKGDILYFDVTNDVREQFDSAFSVGQMPDETAIAWRYGIDRYDIRRVTTFDDLEKLIKDGEFVDVNNKEMKINKIYSFYYSSNGLTETTEEMNKILFGQEKLQNQDFTFHDNKLQFKNSLSSITPLEIDLKINAQAESAENVSFPLIQDSLLQENKIASDSNLRDLAFNYQDFKNMIKKNMVVTASSSWPDSPIVYANDNNINTAWRPDRVLFPDAHEFLTLDLKNNYDIDKVIWINAYANDSPTEYEIDASLDGKNWTQLKRISSNERIESENLQIVSFNPTNLRFIRMKIIKSLNDDSPGIAEIWPVLSKYDLLDINSAEKFIEEPFGYVSDKSQYLDTLRKINYGGNVGIAGQQVNITYDSKSHNYKIIIPPSGITLSEINFGNFEIPGNINIESAQTRNLGIKDFQ